LQERASIGGIVFALVVLWSNGGHDLRFWLAGALCAGFALFATKLSYITFIAGGRDNANVLHVAGNTLFGIGIMVVSNFSPASLFVMLVTVMFLDAFIEGESPWLPLGMLALLTLVPLCAGAPVVVTLAATSSALVAHWFYGARNGQLRSLQNDLKSATYLLRQANDKARHANDRVAVRETELRTAHERVNALQAKLAQSEQLASVGQLAVGVAQELSAPLSTIVGFAREIDGDAGEDSGVRAVVRDSMRCQALAQDLLTFSKSNQAGVQRIDVNALLRGVAQRLDARARSQGTRLKLELSTDSPALLGNVTQLQQAVLDLANGLLGALTPRNLFTLRSHRTWDGNVTIELQDDGAGAGSGPGSPHLHEIARQHGGVIDVKRVAGKGTTARLNFPARSHATVA
jgi:signal transduction histidine kinase